MLTSFFVILLFPWLRALAAQTCGSPYRQSHFQLQGHASKTVNVATKALCIAQCKLHKHCHSINFYQSKRICELNNANHLSNPESLVPSADGEYINYHERPSAKCSNKLCSEPLQCVIDKDGRDYKCLLCKDVERKDILFFPRRSTEDKVVLENPFSAMLTAFTISFWVQADDAFNAHFLISYASRTQFNEIVLYLINNTTNLQIDMTLTTRSFPDSYIDGEWHHFAITWDNVAGSYQIFVDGNKTLNGSNLRVGHEIGTGALVLGQEQDSYMGGFDVSQTFQGNMTSFQMWDKVLPDAFSRLEPGLKYLEFISALAKECHSGEGNVIKWSDLKHRGEGAVKLINN